MTTAALWIILASLWICIICDKLTTRSRRQTEKYLNTLLNKEILENIKLRQSLEWYVNKLIDHTYGDCPFCTSHSPPYPDTCGYCKEIKKAEELLK